MRTVRVHTPLDFLNQRGYVQGAHGAAIQTMADCGIHQQLVQQMGSMGGIVQNPLQTRAHRFRAGLIHG